MIQKHYLFFILIGLFVSLQGHAQDIGFSYQAVALDRSRAESFGRDSEGEVLTNSNIRVRFSLTEGSEQGSEVFSETHEARTDVFGMFRLTVGRGDNDTGASLTTLNWGQTPYFLHVSLDRGNGYEYLGSEELLGAPYSLNAQPQSLALNANQLSISGGNAVILEDLSATNELITSATVSGSVLELREGENVVSVDLGGLLSDVNATDELQDISTSGVAGNLSISDGSTITLNVDDADADATNELQVLVKAGDTVTLSNGGGSFVDVGAFLTNSGATSNSLGDITADDFVFGSISLDDVAGSGDNNRILFDKSKGAFRAGGSLGASWNDANRGSYSVALGVNTMASGSFGSVAIGNLSEASGESSIAVGRNSIATGFASGALGGATSATGSYAFALGFRASASRFAAVALGNSTDASGDASFAAGIGTLASGFGSIALGRGTQATGNHSLASGRDVVSSGAGSSVFGFESRAIGSNSIAAGDSAVASGNISVSLGNHTTASGFASVALGHFAQATGSYTTSLGFRTRASAFGATAMGLSSHASSQGSAALGDSTVASGFNSFATGNRSIAAGTNSFTTGNRTTASGTQSFAAGNITTASGFISTVFGSNTIASGSRSATFGQVTLARSFAETAMGMYNTDYTPNSATAYNVNDRLFVVGNGTSSADTHDALVLYKNGNMTIAGTLTESSDRRLKRNITPLKGSLVKINALQGVHYQWNDVKPHDVESLQTGLIAQEVEEILPGLVQEDAEGYKSVNYIGLVPHLIEAVKELKVAHSREVEDLKLRLEQLERAVMAMQSGFEGTR